MSRYYFHIRDGRILVPDEEGTECGSLIAVHDEARASINDLLDTAFRRCSCLPTIEIEDEDGNTVAVAAATSALN